MKSFSFVVMFFAMLIVGCAPLPRWTCSGGIASQSHTIESADPLSEGFTACVPYARETVTGVEYAGASGPPSWTCEAIGAFYIRLPSGLLTKDLEIVRVIATGFPKSEAHSAAIRGLIGDYARFAQAQGLTFEDLVPETRAFLHRNQQRAASTHRCWYRGHDPHPDVATWPAATWPRPKVQIGGLPGNVPVALAWDPRSTPPPKILDPAEPGKKWTCRGAVYFRVRMGQDLTDTYEIVDELTKIDGPESNAESVLRDFLIARAKAKTAEVTGDMTAFVLDTAGGALDATPIKCWQTTKRGSPADWRGPTPW